MSKPRNTGYRKAFLIGELGEDGVHAELQEAINKASQKSIQSHARKLSAN